MGAEANHGEDVKEYWWYLGAMPSRAWKGWRHHDPQRAFPYELLLDENRRRDKLDPEYELLDAGVFDADRPRNRDGTDDNRSWNCGAEGPTADAEVNALVLVNAWWERMAFQVPADVATQPSEIVCDSFDPGRLVDPTERFCRQKIRRSQKLVSRGHR